MERVSTSPPENSNAPIGVFDSGVGGLSVLRHIRELFPHEELIYIADSGNAPYGGKSAEWIRQRSLELVQKLIARKCKAVVVACNTATAAALQALRERHSIPVIGVEPAVKPAAAMTKTGKVGVLATAATLGSAHFAGLLDRYRANVEFIAQACPGWVECVERGAFDAPGTRELIRSYVTPLMERGVDTLVLGCTHYPFLKSEIAKIAGPDVAILDTGSAIAKQLERKLEGLRADRTEPGNSILYTSAELSGAGPVLRNLWPEASEIFPL